MALGASLLTGFLVKSGFSLGLSLFLMFLCVGLLGLLNGLLITRLKLQPFIATLATCLCFQGITQVYTGNTGTTLSSEQYAALSYLGRGFVFGIPVKVLVVLVVYGFMLWLYHKTSFGVKVRAVGSNEQAADGTPTWVHANWVYVTTALMLIGGGSVCCDHGIAHRLVPRQFRPGLHHCRRIGWFVAVWRSRSLDGTLVALLCRLSRCAEFASAPELCVRWSLGWY